MTREEAKEEVKKVFEPAFADYIITALVEGATESDRKTLVQEPKTGHWIEDEAEMIVWCSQCNESNDSCSKYCPNCGAKMESEE